MKRVESFRNSYEEYLEVCRSINPGSGILDLRKLVKKELPSNYIGLPFGTCLIDYSNREYKYISENCQEISSYEKDEYKSGGLDFNWMLFHPEDKVVFSEQVFSDIKEYWKLIPSKEISEYRFSFNHRYFRKDGTISQILQHGTYLEPQSAGIPIINLLVFTDIGDFKTDTNMILTISRLVKGQGYLKVFSKTYHATRDIPLSARESEVLKLSLEGLSSKMIAEKLFISIQTVKNHKRHMMEKTSAKNIAELIHLCNKNNWV